MSRSARSANPIGALALAAAALLASGPLSADPANEIWLRRCAGCHGVDGSGPIAKRGHARIPDFRAASWQSQHDDAVLAKTIRDGIREKRMPSFKTRLTAAQIDSLVALVRTFKK